MDAKVRKSFLIGFGGVLWLLLLFVAYAFTHKPFTPEQVLWLSGKVWQIIVAFGILSLVGGLGHRSFAGWMKTLNPLVALTLQASLGFGILGLAVLALGVSIGFSRVIFTFFLLFVALIANKSIVLWWRQFGAFALIWQKSGKFDKMLALGSFFILLVTFAKSLVPPLMFDSLVYHLTLPKWYLLAGRITYIPDLMFWGMPQLQEMGMTVALALGGAEAAIVLVWALGVLALAGLLGYLDTFFSASAAWVGVTSLLAGYTLAASLSWGYVGWLTLLYGFGVLVTLDSWKQNRDQKMLWLSAILLGFALGTKYTAAVLVGGVVLVIFFAHGKAGIKLAFRDAFLVGLISFLVFSPWLIKNLLATGNPLYPFIFPSGAMDVYRLKIYQSGHPWGDLRDVFFIPWRATIWGVDHRVGYSAEIGALLLGFSIFAIVGWKSYSEKQKKSLGTALIISVGGFLFWAIAGRFSRLLIQTRLYLAFFSAWAVLAGAGFAYFSKVKAYKIRFGRIASTFIGLAFGFTLFVMGTNFVNTRVLGTLLGTYPEELYREQVLGAYVPAMSMLEKLPSDARTLFLWETRGFSCIPRCNPDEVIDRWYADLHSKGSGEAVLDSWREAGYTHLLFHKQGASFVRENDGRYAAEDWIALDELLSNLVLLEDINGAYQLYSLESAE